MLAAYGLTLKVVHLQLEVENVCKPGSQSLSDCHNVSSFVLCCGCCFQSVCKIDFFLFKKCTYQVKDKGKKSNVGEKLIVT